MTRNYLLSNILIIISVFIDVIILIANFISNKYLQDSYFYIVFIYLLAIKFYTINCFYSVCSKFLEFLKNMQRHFIQLIMLFLKSSLFLYLMPGQWCVPFLPPFYHCYPEHLRTNHSLFIFLSESKIRYNTYLYILLCITLRIIKILKKVKFNY